MYILHIMLYYYRLYILSFYYITYLIGDTFDMKRAVRYCSILHDEPDHPRYTYYAMYYSSSILYYTAYYTI